MARRRVIVRLLVALSAWGWLSTAGAVELRGRVVGIADGDTITLLDAHRRQHRIRLLAVDAPERGQAFGNRSRAHLARLLHGKEARADCGKVDRYRRQVCKVLVRSPDCPRCDATLDVGAAQVSAGMAWWYRQFARDQSAADRRRYNSAEDEARQAQRGLWVDRHPVPPWHWRRLKRNR